MTLIAGYNATPAGQAQITTANPFTLTTPVPAASL